MRKITMMAIAITYPVQKKDDDGNCAGKNEEGDEESETRTRTPEKHAGKKDRKRMMLRVREGDEEVRIHTGAGEQVRIHVFF